MAENPKRLGSVLGKSTTPTPASEIPHSESCNRDAVWRSILSKIGSRYHDCRLATFDVGKPGRPEHDAKTDALRLLTCWAGEAVYNLGAGRGVFLYGPPGTGKDHLAVGLMYRAVAAGYTADWIDAASLAATMRDRMDSGLSEREMIRQLVAPDVLVISDVVPQVGAATPYQLSVLFQVVDGRYREKRSTIVTANVMSGDEAGERLSPAIVDRLRDGALAVFCNWPSYRAGL